MAIFGLYGFINMSKSRMKRATVKRNESPLGELPAALDL